MREIVNVKIKSTSLGYEDHGILTCWLNMEGDGWGQGFGGYALDCYSSVDKKRHGTIYGMEFIQNILKTLEVDSWEKLKGESCRIEKSHEKIHRIGHLVKDKWFDPKDLLEAQHD